MVESVLTGSQVESFHESGFVRLPEAFSPESALAMQEFMWSELKRLNGIDKDDPQTWTNRWKGLNKTGRHGIYGDVVTPRMFRAIDQLLGANTWSKPEGWGAFLVTFPDCVNEPWDVVAGGWHWDGDPGQQVDGLSGLAIFTYYSTVRPYGGGTLVVEGSHHLIVSLFRSLIPNHLARRQKGLKRHFCQSHPWLAELTEERHLASDRIRKFMQEGTVVDSVPLRVIELTGEPGDAVFCHPAILHARSFNRSNIPRFMRVGGAASKERLRRGATSPNTSVPGSG